MEVVAYGDASLGNVEKGRTQGGRIVAIEDGTAAAAIVARSGQLRRVAHASFDAETIIAVDTASDALGVALTLDELKRGPSPSLLEKVMKRSQESGNHDPAGLLYPPTLFTDGNGTVQSVHGSKEPQSKRRQQDVYSLRESLALGDLKAVKWISTDKNPADVLTKAKSPDAPESKVFHDLVYQGKPPPKQQED